mmetsp:Transcript_80325/g.259564  ORF Transcript_80325/g.259564 Transcript_80325/m.259564 type:complete len:319 (-) Transcript_80325:1574-2530(-)
MKREGKLTRSPWRTGLLAGSDSVSAIGPRDSFAPGHAADCRRQLHACAASSAAAAGAAAALATAPRLRAAIEPRRGPRPDAGACRGACHGATGGLLGAPGAPGGGGCGLHETADDVATEALARGEELVRQPLLQVRRGDAQGPLHHIQGKSVAGQLHEVRAHGLEDRAAALPPPLVQGVLHGVVPVGALRQVDRMTRELAEKALLTRAKSALRDALLQDAQAVRTVGDNAKGHRNLLENGVGAQIAEAHQGALHHVRAIRVTAQLHDVLPQRRDQQVPLLLRADEADQGLHRMRAPLVGGHGGQVLQSYLEHAHPLTN